MPVPLWWLKIIDVTRELPLYIRRHNTVIMSTAKHCTVSPSFAPCIWKSILKEVSNESDWVTMIRSPERGFYRCIGSYVFVTGYSTGGVNQPFNLWSAHDWQAWASYDAPSDCSNAFAHLIKDRMIQSHEVWNPCDGEAYQKSLQWMTQRANETPVMGRHDPKSEWHLYWLQLKLSTEVLDRFEEHLTHQFIW